MIHGRQWSPTFMALVATLSFVGVAYSAEPAIRAVEGKEGKVVAVEAIGLPQEQLAALSKTTADDAGRMQLLALYVLNSQGETQPPAMVGRYEVVGDALRFTPQFSLRPGLRYEARFSLPAGTAAGSPRQYAKQIAIPAPPRGEPTRVTALYPSAATLPENQLRFYLHFSAPMSRGEAFSHVKLLKADGKPVERAFLEITGELWDNSGQRLTLLFDPGRVKQGLKPREEFGPVLIAGQKYVLVIDKDWHDAAGQPLAASFEKRFTAGPMIEAAIDAKKWQLTPPAAGTRDPLRIRFEHSLDHALLQRMIAVEGSEKKPISGEITITDDERRWEFRPEQPWAAGGYSLVVDTTLEDTAGNNLARAFEVDVFEKIDKGPTTEFVRIPFVTAAVRVNR